MLRRRFRVLLNLLPLRRFSSNLKLSSLSSRASSIYATLPLILREVSTEVMTAVIAAVVSMMNMMVRWLIARILDQVGDDYILYFFSFA